MGLRTIRTACLVALSLAAANAPGSRAVAQKVVPPETATDVSVTQRWITAVQQHVPGVADASLAAIWAFTPDERSNLPLRLARFLANLLTLAKGETATSTSAAQKRILEMAKDVQRIDPRAFIQRAIVLHTDAALFEDAAPVHQPASRPARGANPGNSLVMATDGEYAGTSEADWNWPWARRLTAILRALPDDGFVGDWYHASTAYMMRRRLYGEAQPHLQKALESLPDDARILFDEGCRFEALGLPRVQDLMTAEDRIVSEGPQRNAVLNARPWVAAANIPREEKTNADAERRFRRVLDVDPHFTEARVRLARLLLARQKFAEAGTEASRAITESTDRTVTFFGHLFAGRADRALGRIDTAAQHFADAVALFPGAQSALLAQSQLALLRPDVAGALAPVRHLAELPPDGAERFDPWWQYDFGPGRLAQELAIGLWARVRPGSN